MRHIFAECVLGERQMNDKDNQSREFYLKGDGTVFNDIFINNKNGVKNGRI